MDNLPDINIVIAKLNEDGTSSFAAGDSVSTFFPGVIGGAFVWATKGMPQIPGNVGSVPEDMSLPQPGDTKFGMMVFPPRSAGKLDMRSSLGTDGTVLEVDEHDFGMHRTATIDYEVIISGKVDIQLANGEIATLTPGTWLVMAGAMHSWQNRYDEPCVCALFVVGANNNEPINQI